MCFAAINTLLAIFILVFINYADAQNLGLGPCPDIKIQSNFNDNDSFPDDGLNMRETPRAKEAFGKCVFFEYIPPMDGYITINRRLVSILTNIEDFHTAQAKVVRPGEAISPDDFDYRVVKTDYGNYAVIHTCRNLPFNLLHMEILWILTREPFPMDEYIEKAYEVIAENRIPCINLFKVDQKNCPPPPEGPLPKIV